MTKQMVLNKCSEEEDMLDTCDVFENVIPELDDPFSHACNSNIEYSQDA